MMTVEELKVTLPHPHEPSGLGSSLGDCTGAGRAPLPGSRGGEHPALNPPLGSLGGGGGGRGQPRGRRGGGREHAGCPAAPPRARRRHGPQGRGGHGHGGGGVPRGDPPGRGRRARHRGGVATGARDGQDRPDGLAAGGRKAADGAQDAVLLESRGRPRVRGHGALLDLDGPPGVPPNRLHLPADGCQPPRLAHDGGAGVDGHLVDI
mmetsp:Transcript_48638/g.155643  ORF Transcript_48638/g.155643 Transcript_48638/m.155643 type:complete len:207 (+) Transcript_48638:1069-1689(+)